MSNVLDGIGARIDRLPVEFLDTAIDIFVETAERHGGRMMGRYQSTAAATGRTVRDDVASVIMQGVPSGFWVWRETGTKPHTIRPKRKKALAGELSHPIWGEVIHPGVAGQRRWTRTVTDAEKAIHAAAQHVADRLAA